MTLVVFDIFHFDYDPETGHTEQANQLEVQVILFGRDDKPKKLAANEMGSFLNRRIQEKHNVHGWGSTPPFRTDRRDGNVPEYGLPRTAGECPNTPGSSQLPNHHFLE